MIQVERSEQLYHWKGIASSDWNHQNRYQNLASAYHHLTYLLFKYRHALPISILVGYSLSHLLLFHNAKTPDCQIRVAHDIRHNITLNLVIILLITMEELNLVKSINSAMIGLSGAHVSTHPCSGRYHSFEDCQRSPPMHAVLHIDTAACWCYIDKCLDLFISNWFIAPISKLHYSTCWSVDITMRRRTCLYRIYNHHQSIDS